MYDAIQHCKVPQRLDAAVAYPDFSDPLQFGCIVAKTALKHGRIAMGACRT